MFGHARLSAAEATWLSAQKHNKTFREDALVFHWHGTQGGGYTYTYVDVCCRFHKSTICEICMGYLREIRRVEIRDEKYRSELGIYGGLW